VRFYLCRMLDARIAGITNAGYHES
jgi:hypothetical protein